MMNQNIKSLLLNIAALILIIVLLWQASTILIYLIISCGFAVIGNNIADRMEKIKIKKKSLPRGISALLIILSFYAIFFFLLGALLPIFDKQIDTLSNINTDQLLYNLNAPIEGLQHKIQQWTGNEHFNLIETIKEQMSTILSFSNLTLWLESITSFATDILFGLFSITFITFFLIKDGDKIYNNIISLLPETSQDKVENILSNSLIQLRKYFIGVALETAIIAVLLSITLGFAGVEQYLIIAIIAALLNIIPYVGPISAMVIAAIIIIAGNYDLPFEAELLPLLSKTIIIMIVVHFIDSLLLQPYIYSSSVNAHPLEIFLVILVAGSVGGILALIFAIPAYTVLRIIVSELKAKPITE